MNVVYVIVITILVIWTLYQGDNKDQRYCPDGTDCPICKKYWCDVLLRQRLSDCCGAPIKNTYHNGLADKQICSKCSLPCKLKNEKK